MLNTSVAVSAPGKVLFTGGFLVLDRKHTGLVFGLNARIHVHIQEWDGLQGQQGLESASKSNSSLILVESPQFDDAKWLYQIKEPLTEHNDNAVSVEQITNLDNFTKSKNKFVELTLQYTLTYLSHLPQHKQENSHPKLLSRPYKITILADNDYYSQSDRARHEEIKNGFIHFGVNLSQAHKTGLGSSAALVTALVGALLHFYTPSTDADPVLQQRTIHNLAQAAHCAAQGKVGSGFDIAAAVYGSCLYRRFTPTILERVGDATSPGFGERLHRCVDDLDPEMKWDVEVADTMVRVPDGLLLVMCDVDCGSETPGMVRKVLQWRRENPSDAELLWTAIQQGSDDLCRELLRLSEMNGIEAKEDGVDTYKELSDILQTIRSLVREESKKSDVPIEPEVITELLDFCTDVPGVVGGVAPGAGGYDAVALLVKNDGETIQTLQRQLEGWKAKEAGTGVKIGKVKLLSVKQDKEGARIENAGNYAAWTG